jgi:hypothetical protein
MNNATRGIWSWPAAAQHRRMKIDQPQTDMKYKKKFWWWFVMITINGFDLIYTDSCLLPQDGALHLYPPVTLKQLDALACHQYYVPVPRETNRLGTYFMVKYKNF